MRLLRNLYTWSRRGALGNPGWQDAATSRELLEQRGPLAERAREVIAAERTYLPLLLHGHQRSPNHYPDILIYSPLEDGGIFILQYWLGYDGATGRTDQYRVWSFVLESWPNSAFTPGQILTSLSSFHATLEEHVRDRQLPPIAPPTDRSEEDHCAISSFRPTTVARALEALLDSPRPTTSHVVLTTIDPGETRNFWRAVCSLVPKRLRPLVSFATGVQQPHMARYNIVGLLPGQPFDRERVPPGITVIDPAGDEYFTPRHLYVRWIWPRVDGVFDSRRIDDFARLFEETIARRPLATDPAQEFADIDRLAEILLDLAAVPVDPKIDPEDLVVQIAALGNSGRSLWPKVEEAFDSLMEADSEDVAKLRAALSYLRLTGSPLPSARLLVTRIADRLAKGQTDAATDLLIKHCLATDTDKDETFEWLLDTLSEWTAKELSAWFGNALKTRESFPLIREIGRALAGRANASAAQRNFLVALRTHAQAEAEAEVQAMLTEAAEATISASDEQQLSALPEEDLRLLLGWLLTTVDVPSVVGAIVRAHHLATTAPGLRKSLLSYTASWIRNNGRPRSLRVLLEVEWENRLQLHSAGEPQELPASLRQIVQAMAESERRRLFALWTELSSCLASLLATQSEPLALAALLLNKIRDEGAELPLRRFVAAVMKEMENPPQTWYQPPPSWIAREGHDLELCEDLTEDLESRAKPFIEAFVGSEQYQKSLIQALDAADNPEGILTDERRAMLGRTLPSALNRWWRGRDNLSEDDQIERANLILRFQPSEGQDLDRELLSFFFESLAAPGLASSDDNPRVQGFQLVRSRLGESFEVALGSTPDTHFLEALRNLRPIGTPLFAELAQAALRNTSKPERPREVAKLLVEDGPGASDICDPPGLVEIVDISKKLAYASQICIFALSHATDRFKDTVGSLSISANFLPLLRRLLLEKLWDQRSEQGDQSSLSAEEVWLYGEFLQDLPPIQDSTRTALNFAMLLEENWTDGELSALRLQATQIADLMALIRWIREDAVQTPDLCRRAFNLLLSVAAVDWRQPQEDQELSTRVLTAICSSNPIWGEHFPLQSFDYPLADVFFEQAFSKGRQQLRRVVDLISDHNSIIIQAIRKRMVDDRDSELANKIIEGLFKLREVDPPASYDYLPWFINALFQDEPQLDSWWHPPHSLVQPVAGTYQIPLLEMAQATESEILKKIFTRKAAAETTMERLAKHYHEALCAVDKVPGNEWQEAQIGELGEMFSRLPQNRSIGIYGRLLQLVKDDTRPADRWLHLGRAIEYCRTTHEMEWSSEDAPEVRGLLISAANLSNDTGRYQSLALFAMAILEGLPEGNRLEPTKPLLKLLENSFDRSLISSDECRLPRYVRLFGRFPELENLLDRAVERIASSPKAENVAEIREAFEAVSGGITRSQRYRKALFYRLVGTTAWEKTVRRLYGMNSDLPLSDCPAIAPRSAEWIGNYLKKGVPDPERLANAIIGLLDATATSRRFSILAQVLTDLKSKRCHGSQEEHVNLYRALDLVGRRFFCKDPKVAKYLTERLASERASTQELP